MNNEKHGVQLHPDIIELFIMLFADDVVLLSYTSVGLQHQLNLLEKKRRRPRSYSELREVKYHCV